MGHNIPEQFSNLIVFDIETYRPERGLFGDRRIELDPETNYITVIGTYDGRTIDCSPVTPLGSSQKEIAALKWFGDKISEAGTIAGFNILGFDIPYLAYKSSKYGIDLKLAGKHILDMFLFPAAWMDNTASGRKFAGEYDIGKVLSLNKVEKYLLRKAVNPISHDQYFKMYEAGQYDGIVEKLKFDLVSSYELLVSPQVSDTLEWIKGAGIDIAKCISTCPFRSSLSLTNADSQHFCTLLGKPVSEPIRSRPIDIIGRRPFLEKGTQFSARCLR